MRDEIGVIFVTWSLKKYNQPREVDVRDEPGSKFIKLGLEKLVVKITW